MSIYTEKEKRFLGKQVVINQQIIYGGNNPDFLKGDRAVIYDFGSGSGDPIVRNMRTNTTAVIGWDHFDLV